MGSSGGFGPGSGLFFLANCLPMPTGVLTGAARNRCLVVAVQFPRSSLKCITGCGVACVWAGNMSRVDQKTAAVPVLNWGDRHAKGAPPPDLRKVMPDLRAEERRLAAGGGRAPALVQRLHSLAGDPAQQRRAVISSRAGAEEGGVGALPGWSGGTILPDDGSRPSKAINAMRVLPRKEKGAEGIRKQLACFRNSCRMNRAAAKAGIATDSGTVESANEVPVMARTKCLGPIQGRDGGRGVLTAPGRLSSPGVSCGPPWCRA